jgi:hypothetical protein
MRGEGAKADLIAQMFRLAKQKFLAGKSMPDYNLASFRHNPAQLNLF